MMQEVYAECPPEERVAPAELKAIMRDQRALVLRNPKRALMTLPALLNDKPGCARRGARHRAPDRDRLRPAVGRRPAPAARGSSARSAPSPGRHPAASKESLPQ
jgi:hypothetical protein